MDRNMCKAKRQDNGEWVYGYYVCVPNEYGHDMANLIITPDCSYRGAGEFWYMDVHEVDPDTVCQSTGHYDRHNNLIFENDVVGFGRAGLYRDKDLVWFCKEMCMLTAVPIDGIEFDGYDYWNDKYPRYEYSTFCLMLQDPCGDFSDIKVLGNIIDNPELLEV